MVFNGSLRLAISSDGALFEPTQAFLRSCGIGVSRSNPRRYIADIPALPGVTVMFQRGADITPKVEEGSADLGVVGLDRYLEMSSEGADSGVVIDDLDFGRCELVLGVPDSWVDVVSLADLADLSMEFRQQGRDLRIVTKYPRLVERFLLRSGINLFSLVHSSGTLEAAVAMGFADIIADVSESGTTMRENRLKTISGGTIISSQACLISNQRLLSADSAKLDRAKRLVDVMEGASSIALLLQCYGEYARGNSGRCRTAGTGAHGDKRASGSDNREGVLTGRRGMVRRDGHYQEAQPSGRRGQAAAGGRNERNGL